MDNNPFHFKDFAQRHINYVCQLFKPDGSIKVWHDFKTEFGLENRHYFKFLQITDSLPPEWRQIMLNEPRENIGFFQHTQGLLQCTKIVPIEKLISRQIYSILIRNKNHIPTSRHYFNEKFPDIANNWMNIYTLPRMVTKNAYDRVFQYKLINNTLYLNKKLFQFGLEDSPSCSFCENEDEDPMHLFSVCHHTISLWSSLQTVLAPNIMLPNLNSKFALLGFYEASPNDFTLLNHILLLFKIYIYQRRPSKLLLIEGLINKIKEIASLECSLSSPGTTSYERYRNKWRPIDHLT